MLEIIYNASVFSPTLSYVFVRCFCTESMLYVMYICFISSTSLKQMFTFFSMLQVKNERYVFIVSNVCVHICEYMNKCIFIYVEYLYTCRGLLMRVYNII